MFLNIPLDTPIKLLNYATYSGNLNKKINFSSNIQQKYFLFIIYQGTIFFNDGKKTITAKAKSWLISNKEFSIQMVPDKTIKPVIYIFEFTSKEVIQKNLSLPLFDTNSKDNIIIPQIGKIIDSPAIKSLLELFSLTHRVQHKELISKYLLSNIIIILEEQFLQTARNNFNNQIPAKFEKIIQWVTTHDNEELTVTKLAHNFDITPEYLTYLFKKFEGVTTLQFIHNLKISRAKDLLLTTNMSVKQIGYYLSFNNIKYFMRLFKRKTGVTPTEFRNNFSTKLPNMKN